MRIIVSFKWNSVSVEATCTSKSNLQINLRTIARKFGAHCIYGFCIRRQQEMMCAHQAHRTSEHRRSHSSNTVNNLLNCAVFQILLQLLLDIFSRFIFNLLTHFSAFIALLPTFSFPLPSMFCSCWCKTISELTHFESIDLQFLLA